VKERVVRSAQLGLPSVREGETEDTWNTKEFAHCGFPYTSFLFPCLFFEPGGVEGVDGVVTFSAGFAGVPGCILAGLILCCCELEEVLSG